MEKESEINYINIINLMIEVNCSMNNITIEQYIDEQIENTKKNQIENIKKNQLKKRKIMKLKKILKNNSIDLRKHYYEEAIHIDENTPQEVLDLILSSSEFKKARTIEYVKDEDIKNLVTISLRSNIDFKENVKICLISFANNNFPLLRLTKDSLKMRKEDFKKEYRVVEDKLMSGKSIFYIEYSSFSEGYSIGNFNYPFSINWFKVEGIYESKECAIKNIKIHKASRIKKRIVHYID